MQGRLFLSTGRPPVLTEVSVMFALLWSWRVPKDSASANTCEPFRAAALLSSCLWDVMSFRSCERGDGVTSQALLFPFVYSDPGENSFLASPSYSYPPYHTSLGFCAGSNLGSLRGCQAVASEAKPSSKGLKRRKALRAVCFFTSKEEGELSMLKLDLPCTFQVLLWSRAQSLLLRVSRLGAGWFKGVCFSVEVGGNNKAFRRSEWILSAPEKWYQISYSGHSDHFRPACASPFYFLVFFIMRPCPGSVSVLCMSTAVTQWRGLIFAQSPLCCCNTTAVLLTAHFQS